MEAKEGSPVKAELVPKEWSCPRFREYLLALTRGPEFLLAIDQYPQRIELSSPWHELLNRMREESRDGIERWAFTGFKEDKHTLILSDPIKGKRGSVPREIVSQRIHQAKEKAHVADLIGDIHSHPVDWWKTLFNDLENILLKPFGGKAYGFSPHDLYSMLQHERFLPMKVLVEANNNLLAFRSSQTETLPPIALGFTQEKFAQYWVKQVGGRIVKIGESDIVIGGLHANPWEVNKRIAERHKLVLYQGKPNQDLIRAFPARSF